MTGDRMLPTPDESRRLAYGIPEICKLLGISTQAGYRAVRAGDLPSVRVGRRVLVPVARLESLLAGESLDEIVDEKTLDGNVDECESEEAGARTLRGPDDVDLFSLDDEF